MGTSWQAKSRVMAVGANGTQELLIIGTRSKMGGGEYVKSFAGSTLGKL